MNKPPPAAGKITSLKRRKSPRGQIAGSARYVLATFSPTRPANDETAEFIIRDRSEIDGVVVGVCGTHDVAHVRLQLASEAVYSITIMDMALARALASRFRRSSVRIHVHGTWKRTSSGVWEPLALYGDRFDDLDQSNPYETCVELASITGNEWATTEDAEDVWEKPPGTR